MGCGGVKIKNGYIYDYWLYSEKQVSRILRRTFVSLPLNDPLDMQHDKTVTFQGVPPESEVNVLGLNAEDYAQQSARLGKKRNRDVRGIDKFRQIIYGDNGFKRLRAVAERSTVLMYPPQGVVTARQQQLLEDEEAEALVHRELQYSAQDIDVEDLLERKKLHHDAPHRRAVADVANYHHKQLDCFLKLVYEFNHASLMKLPMTDTLHMLSRCGKEAGAHLTEYEMHARLQRFARIEEIAKLRQQKVELEQRQRTMNAERDAMEMELAEEQLRLAAAAMQAQLEEPLEDAAALRKHDELSTAVAITTARMGDHSTSPTTHCVRLDVSQKLITVFRWLWILSSGRTALASMFVFLPSPVVPEAACTVHLMTRQIFLHCRGGRTLWVPSHNALPHETEPVMMLQRIQPSELSRSFYLFDQEIQLVPPSTDTPEDVQQAVSRFRAMCKENERFLLAQCYDPKRDIPPRPSQPPVMSGPNTLSTPPGEMGINNMLMQFIQQQQQQQQQPVLPLQPSPQPPVMPTAQQIMYGQDGMNSNFAPATPPPVLQSPYNSLSQAPPTNFMGGGQGQYPGFPIPGSSAGGGIPYFPPPMQPSYTGGFQGGGAMMIAPGNQGMAQQPFQNYAPYAPDMFGAGMGEGSRGRRNNRNHEMGRYGGQQLGSGRERQNFMAPGSCQEPEPIDQLRQGVEVPKDVLSTYRNPAQKLVCATMPGARMTVWLRDHEIPTEPLYPTKAPKYVFCKGGIILMMKAHGSEVEKSKPVELFPKQICMHFLVHGHCSRRMCIHKHHSEEQLRELIAIRHVQQKAMSKKQRHDLIAGILKLEADNLEKFAEERATRAKERNGRESVRDPPPTAPKPSVTEGGKGETEKKLKASSTKVVGVAEDDSDDTSTSSDEGENEKAGPKFEDNDDAPEVPPKIEQLSDGDEAQVDQDTNTTIPHPDTEPQLQEVPKPKCTVSPAPESSVSPSTNPNPNQSPSPNPNPNQSPSPNPNPNQSPSPNPNQVPARSRAPPERGGGNESSGQESQEVKGYRSAELCDSERSEALKNRKAESTPFSLSLSSLPLPHICSCEKAFGVHSSVTTVLSLCVLHPALFGEIIVRVQFSHSFCCCCYSLLLYHFPSYFLLVYCLILLGSSSTLVSKTVLAQFHVSFHSIVCSMQAATGVCFISTPCSAGQGPLTKGLPDAKVYFTPEDTAHSPESVSVSTLPNGARVISHNLRGPMVSVGAYILAGSSYDPIPCPGVSSLLHHALAGGANAPDVHRSLQRTGAQLNNYELFKHYIALRLDSQGGLWQKPLAELPNKASVVQQSLFSSLATPPLPEEAADLKALQKAAALSSTMSAGAIRVSHELESIAFFKQRLGSPRHLPLNNVQGVSAELLREQYNRFVLPSRIVIAGVNVSHGDLVAAYENTTAQHSETAEHHQKALKDMGKLFAAGTETAQYTGGERHDHTEGERETRVALGWLGVGRHHSQLKQHAASLVVESMLEARCRKLSPLGYLSTDIPLPVSAFYHPFQTAGLIGVTVVAEPREATKLVSEAAGMVQSAVQCVAADELEAAKVSAQIAFRQHNLESIRTYCDFLGTSLPENPNSSVPRKAESILEALKNVEVSDVQRVAAVMFSSPVSLYACGNTLALPSRAQLGF
eukprot:gene4285-3101_t